MKLPKRLIQLSIGLIALSQVAFAFYAPTYTKERHTAQLFATIGIRYDGTDLHKLNEGAHYFGQTIIGWTKFPSFVSDVTKAAGLPEGSSVSARMQERQNLIFEIQSPVALAPEAVLKVRQFIDQKLQAYNQVANVRIQLANVDSAIVNERRSYFSGALIALILSLVAAAGARMRIRAFSGAFSATSKNI